MRRAWVITNSPSTPNATNNSGVGGFSATDVFRRVFDGRNSRWFPTRLRRGTCGWRSAYTFTRCPCRPGGSTADVDLRLRATMWGNPAFWDTTGYYEFGQTFVASGPITMIFLRDPFEHSLHPHRDRCGPAGRAERLWAWRGLTATAATNDWSTDLEKCPRWWDRRIIFASVRPRRPPAPCSCKWIHDPTIPIPCRAAVCISATAPR
jgi:hypothetical protein